MSFLRRLELITWKEAKRMWSVRWIAAALLVDVVGFIAENFGVLSDKLPASRFYALGSLLTLGAGVARIVVQRKP